VLLKVPTVVFLPLFYKQQFAEDDGRREASEMLADKETPFVIQFSSNIERLRAFKLMRHLSGVRWLFMAFLFIGCVIAPPFTQSSRSKSIMR
jgi:hypothetical protein